MARISLDSMGWGGTEPPGGGLKHESLNSQCMGCDTEIVQPSWSLRTWKVFCPECDVVVKALDKAYYDTTPF